jgi:hypothetical protein
MKQKKMAAVDMLFIQIKRDQGHRPQPCLDLEYPPKAHVLMAWSPACEAGGTL